ncbi:hypothetical protein D3C80_1218140 [compost metagenome]
MIHRQPVWQGGAAALEFVAQLQSFNLHALFNLTPCQIERIKIVSQHTRLRDVITQQQGHADRHIIQPPGGVEPRPQRKAEIVGRQLTCITISHFQQRPDARPAFTGADAVQALVHQNAVVGVEWHHVRHRTERDQIQQFRQVRHRQRTLFEPAAVTQPRTQRQHQIKSHTDAGQGFGRELTAAQVRVDDRFRRRQGFPRQVVVSHQHLHAFGVGHVHSRMGRDAVIHREDQFGTARRRLFDHFGTQAVAVLKTIRHQIIDRTAAHAAQRQHRQRSTGGAISVEVPHHHDAATRRQRLLQNANGGVNAIQLLPRQHAFDAAFQFLLSLNAAQRI